MKLRTFSPFFSLVSSRKSRTAWSVLWICCAVLAAPQLGRAQTLLFSESFETPGGDYGYSIDPPNDCGCCENNDQWGRTTGLGLFSCSGIAAADYPPTGISGSFFFGAEDVDDPDVQSPAGSAAPLGILYLDTVNVDGLIQLELEVDLATPISSTTAPPGYLPAGPFEADDSVVFQYAFNADIVTENYTTFAALRANASGDLALDSDGDGTIDGIALDSAFRRFRVDIPQNGKLLRIRVVYGVNDAQEEVALDRVQAFGCTPPTPPSAIAGDSLLCKGDSTTLSIVGGDLGDWSDWTWYEGSCGGAPIGTGTSITVAPGSTTNYFVGPTGGCVPIAACRAFRVFVQDLNASFTTTTPTAGCAPILVSYQNTNPEAASLLWRFYDDDPFPGVSTGANPSFLYSSFGDYDVELIVTDTFGCVDTVFADDFVTAFGTDAHFTADVTSGCNPLEVNFSDTSISYSSVVGWTWDFGDGGSAAVAAPTYSYVDGGVYDVSLTVTDANGCVNSISKSDYILTDTIAPVISYASGDAFIPADAACTAVLPDFVPDAVISDACIATVVVEQTPAAGTPFGGLGIPVTVWIKASDGGGNADSISFLATMVDSTAPALTPVSDQDLFADAACSANLPDFTGLTTVSDACDATPLITQTPAAATPLSGAGSSVTVWLVATDASGNADSTSFAVTLQDTTAPSVVFAPGDQVLVLDGSCDAVLPDYTGTATISDACDATPTVVQVPAGGGVYSTHGTVIPVKIYATDASGNTDSTSFNVTLEDQAAPVFGGFADQVQVLDGSCQVSLNDFRSAITVSDNCDATPALVQDPAPGSVFGVAGTIVPVKIFATDAVGNVDSLSFNVTLEDQAAPSLTPVADQDLFADAACSANLPDFTGLTTVSDACDATPLITQTPAAATPLSGAGSSVTVWLVATDASGNADSTSFAVTLQDTTAPSVVFAPGDQVLVLDGSCDAVLPDYTGTATISDACDATPTVVQVPAGGGVYSTHGTVIPVKIYATDASGNTDSTSFNVTLEDQAAPVFGGFADQVQVLDGSCQVSLNDFRSAITVSDNCDATPALVQDPAPGSVFGGAGTIVPVKIFATDAVGNVDSLTFIVSLEDQTAPSLTPVADQDLIVDAVSCAATLPDYRPLSTVSDACDASPVVVQTPAPGSGFSGASTSVTVWLVATDASGNADSTSLVVTLQDNVAPSISFPAGDQTAIADAACSAILPDYRASAVVSDACDGAPVVVQSPIPGTLLSGAGTSISVWLFATDVSGNTDSTSFSFSVQDLTDPVLPAIPDQVQWLDAACQTTLMDYRSLTSPSDNCDTSVTLTQSPAPGSLLSGVGVQAVTITAEDASGNTTSIGFNVTLNDPLPPSITLPADQDVTVDASCSYVLPDFRPMVGISDNCDATPVLVQSPAPGSVLDGTMGSIAVTMTLTDASGYFTSGTFTVNPIDNQAPSLVCPASSDILVSGLCTGPIPDFTSEVAVADNCDALPSLIQTPSAGTLLTGAGATATVVVTATDASGNSSTCPIVVTVVDDEEPVIVCPADDVVVLNDGCKADLEDYTPLVSASDNCELSPILQVPAPGTLFSGHGLSEIVTFSVWDAAGDTATCSINVTFTDTASPVIPVLVDTTVAVDTTCTTVIPDLVAALPCTDNCTAPVDLFYTQMPAAGTVIVDTTMVTLTARDLAGNEASRSVRVNVNKAVAPVFETCPADISVSTDSADCGASVLWDAPVANAFCYGFSVSSTSSPGDFFEPGFHPVFYTVTNDQGLSASCAFGITVQDSESPVVECPGDTTIIQDQLPFFYDVPVASDNCGLYSVSLVEGIGGGVYPLGSTNEVYEALDSAGNATVCSFVVTLERNPVSGIDQPEVQHLLDAYPNPTSGQLFVEVQSPDAVHLRLLDALGRLRMLREVPPSSANGTSIEVLDLSTLPAGIYYVIAEGDGWRRSARIVALD